MTNSFLGPVGGLWGLTKGVAGLTSPLGLATTAVPLAAAAFPDDQYSAARRKARAEAYRNALRSSWGVPLTAPADSLTWGSIADAWRRAQASPAAPGAQAAPAPAPAASVPPPAPPAPPPAPPTGPFSGLPAGTFGSFGAPQMAPTNFAPFSMQGGPNSIQGAMIEQARKAAGVGFPARPPAQRPLIRDRVNPDGTPVIDVDMTKPPPGASPQGPTMPQMGFLGPLDQLKALITGGDPWQRVPQAQGGSNFMQAFLDRLRGSPQGQ